MSEERYSLTEEACMMEALKEFGIDVSIKMARAIKDVFMEYMMIAGYIEKQEADN